MDIFPFRTLAGSDRWPGEVSGKGRATGHCWDAAGCAVGLNQMWDRPEKKEGRKPQ